MLALTVEGGAQVSTAALELFAFGQAEAAQRGQLLVDTKYEFGKDAAGNILLVDEVGILQWEGTGIVLRGVL